MEKLLKKIVLMSVLALFYAHQTECARVFVRNLDGSTSEIELNKLANSDELYQLVALDNGIQDHKRLRLRHAGHEIDTDLSLLQPESTLNVIALKSPEYRRLNKFLYEIDNEDNADTKSIKLGAETSNFLPQELSDQQKDLIDQALEKEAEGDIDNYNNILVSLLRQRLSELDNK